MSLAVLFSHTIAMAKAGLRSKEDFLNWLSDEDIDIDRNSSGIPVAHHMLQELGQEDIHLIREMLMFVSSCSEGQIFSFLMNRNLSGDTIGHVLCSQEFCQKYDVIALGILDSFFACLDKLSPQSRPDYLLAKGERSLILDDVIREMRIDSVKRAYYLFFQKEVVSDSSQDNSSFSINTPSRRLGNNINFFKSEEEILPPPNLLKKGPSNRKKILANFHTIEQQFK